MGRKVGLFLFLFFLSTCKTEIEKDIAGSWEIQQAYYNNEPVINDLLSNSLGFSDDSRCYLPIKEIGERKVKADEGSWEIETEPNNRTILSIRTTNKIFNRRFYISNFDKKTDERSGYKFIEMTIEADSLKLDLIRKWDVR